MRESSKKAGRDEASLVNRISFRRHELPAWTDKVKQSVNPSAIPPVSGSGLASFAADTGSRAPGQAFAPPPPEAAAHSGDQGVLDNRPQRSGRDGTPGKHVGDLSDAPAPTKDVGTAGARPPSPGEASKGRGTPSAQVSPARRSADADNGGQGTEAKDDGETAEVVDKRPRPKKGTYAVYRETPRPKKQRNAGGRAKQRDSESDKGQESEDEDPQDQDSGTKGVHATVLKLRDWMATVAPTKRKGTMNPYADMTPRIASRLAKDAMVNRTELTKDGDEDDLPSFSSLLPHEHPAYDFIRPNFWELIDVSSN